MKKTFVTYGDDNYRESLERIGREARATGVFDSVRLYTPADLPEPFASYTRAYPRGGGYWLWKPFVIVSELDRAAEGDIVVYADAGCTLMPHADWQRYFDAVDGREELFFLAEGKSAKWCKKEVFDYFGTRRDAWKNASQVQATFIIARKSGRNEVLRRWYDLAVAHPELFVDAAAGSVQGPRFREHRHDQAVLTACVCASDRPRAFRLDVEKVERRHAGGQAVFASRISNGQVRGNGRVKGRLAGWLERLFVNPLKVASARLLFALSRG
jgi:hypothetical protein